MRYKTPDGVAMPILPSSDSLRARVVKELTTQGFKFSLYQKNEPQKEQVQPYSTVSHFEHANYPYLYFVKHNCQPSRWTSHLKIKDLSNLFEKLNTKVLHISETQSDKNPKEDVLGFCILEYLDAFIVLEKTYKESSTPLYQVQILYQERSTLETIKSNLEFVEEVESAINLIHKNNYGQFSLFPCTIVLPDNIDIEDNYNGLIEKYEKIKDICQNSLSGLALLSGEPGTGKSTFLKHIISQVNRQVIYLPTGLTNYLSSPELVGFLVSNKGGIFIIEDAEEALMSRDKQTSPAIANILNLTDGLLGDCVQTLIIATFNTDKTNIDSALLRKGRLLFEHEFTKLSPEKCRKIWNKLNIEQKTDVPLSLAEVFHQETNYHEVKPVKRLGF